MKVLCLCGKLQTGMILQGVDMRKRSWFVAVLFLFSSIGLGFAQADFSLSQTNFQEFVPPPIVRNVYIRYYLLGGSLGSVGFDYFFDRNFWAGFNVGLSYVPGIGPGRTLVVVTDTLEAGYYLLGNIDQDFRLGALFTFSAYFCPTADTWREISDKPFWGIYPGPWLTIEAWNISLRAGLVYDFNAANPMVFFPAFGLVF